MIDQGTAMAQRDPQIRRAPNSAGLYDVLDLILDKGIVIDAFVRVSLVGIELVTIDARVVIASVDTYLRYAEGAERLQLYKRGDSKSLPEFVGDSSKRKMATKGVEAAGRMLGGGSDDDDEGEGQESQEQEGVVGKLAKGVRNVVGRLAHTVSGGGDEGGEGGQEQQPRDRERRPERQQERPHRGNGSGKPAKAGAGGRR